LKNVEVGNPVLVVEDGVVEPLEVEDVVVLAVAVLEEVAALEEETPVGVVVAVRALDEGVCVTV
jgi:hypothetical protein